MRWFLKIRMNEDAHRGECNKQSKSEKEKWKHHLCVELKKITNDYVPNRNRLSDIENRLRAYQRVEEER